MVKILVCTGIFLLVSFCSTAQAVKCYQCAYVKGVNDHNLNPDCVSNVESGSVQMEEGAACIKAEGTTGGNYFMLRLAYRPGYNQITLPVGQQSATCAAANVNITKIGERRVDSFDTCEVCNDKEACNSSSFMTVNLGIILFSSILGLFLCH